MAEENKTVEKKVQEVASTSSADKSQKTEEKSSDSTQRRPYRRFDKDSQGRRRPGTGDKRRPNRPGFGGRPRRGDKRKKDFGDKDSGIETTIIQVRRVSKTVKGGRKMRFSALIVAGDRKGKVGFGLAKGSDFQDAVNKATRKAKDGMIKIDINDDNSIKFPINFKYKSSRIYIKPAQSGTGVIAGGFLRPVLQLAGIQNVYSKIIGSTNKVTGVRATFEGLSHFYKATYQPRQEKKTVEKAA